MPLDGISAIVVISTPEVTPVSLIASLTSSCLRSSKSSTNSREEYDTLTLSSNLLFTRTWMYLSIARDTTFPPLSSDLENESISVPPPQKEALRGVRLIIIRLVGSYTTHQDDGLLTIISY